MRIILAALAVILALPVLALVAVALGPVSLVILFIAGFALLVLLANFAISRNRG